jgi:hypothetical protein
MLDGKTDDIRKTGILRGYGTGEFEATDVPSLINLGNDLSREGLGYGGYTKNLNQIEIFGDTGFKYNISCGGEPRMGHSLEDAQVYRERYPNVGTVYVTTNEKELFKIAGDPRVDHIIPVHLGGGTPEKWLSDLTSIEFKNFQSSQTEKIGDVVIHSKNLDGKKASELIGKDIKPMFEKYKSEPWYYKLIGTGKAEYGQKADLPKIDMTKSNMDKAYSYMMRPDIDYSVGAEKYSKIADKIVNAGKKGGKAAIEALDAKYLSLLAAPAAAAMSAMTNNE